MSNQEEDEIEARQEAYALLDAMELTPPRERLALAIQAIRADPTLSDGYAAAAFAMPQNSRPALAAWLAAKEIARRDAGVSLERDAGQLWSVMQVRPYLRASVGYALCALENGDHDEAIAQLNQLLSAWRAYADDAGVYEADAVRIQRTLRLELKATRTRGRPLNALHQVWRGSPRSHCAVSDRNGSLNTARKTDHRR